MKWQMSNSSYDKELGTHHLLMVAWGCFVLYMYEVVIKNGSRFDDRPDKGLLTDEEFEYHMPAPNPAMSKEDLAAEVKFWQDKHSLEGWWP